jgi:hypothetical protein
METARSKDIHCGCSPLGSQTIESNQPPSDYQRVVLPLTWVADEVMAMVFPASRLLQKRV